MNRGEIPLKLERGPVDTLSMSKGETRMRSEITITGTLELRPGTETIIPLPTGRGPWTVRLVRALRVVKTYRDEIGMTRTVVEVEPVGASS